jgi:3-carboxy-cis,cis-muconate cycloisomerase
MNYPSKIYSKYLGDEQLLQLVCDESFIAKMLQFEMALARVQARLRIIPKKDADEIVSVLGKIRISPGSLAEGTLQNGVPVIALLSEVRERLSPNAKASLHFGATSQDVMDTAQVLIIREAIQVLRTRLVRLIGNLNMLTKKYGQVPCMAHTRGQQALPITLGVKIKAWVLPLQRQVERLAEVQKRVLSVQLGGAVGSRSSYGNKSQQMVKALAHELRLQPSNPWHTQRDCFCEFTNWLAMSSGILGKLGADILVMSQTEIGEVVENREGGGKSSAMPHKNNPVLSEALVALSRINAVLQSQLVQSLVHTGERDATAWILEWNAIPQMMINTGVALIHATTISKHINVDRERMKMNIDKFSRSFLLPREKTVNRKN